MALQSGTVTVNSQGSATGSGLAIAIFNGVLAAVPENARKQIASSMGPFCEALATAIVTHFTENAEINLTIATTDSGLQRIPYPPTVGTPTDGPASDVTLSGSIL